MFQTEITFTLPLGYVDAAGHVHQHGRMRMATVLDEIAPNGHPQAQANDAYLVVLLMARVVTQLGDLPTVTPEVIEGLFVADMAYLEDLYLVLNSPKQMVVAQ